MYKQIKSYKEGQEHWVLFEDISVIYDWKLPFKKHSYSWKWDFEFRKFTHTLRCKSATTIYKYFEFPFYWQKQKKKYNEFLQKKSLKLKSRTKHCSLALIKVSNGRLFLAGKMSFLKEWEGFKTDFWSTVDAQTDISAEIGARDWLTVTKLQTKQPSVLKSYYVWSAFYYCSFKNNQASWGGLPYLPLFKKKFCYTRPAAFMHISSTSSSPAPWCVVCRNFPRPALCLYFSLFFQRQHGGACKLFHLHPSPPPHTSSFTGTLVYRWRYTQCLQDGNLQTGREKAPPSPPSTQRFIGQILKLRKHWKCKCWKE